MVVAETIIIGYIGLQCVKGGVGAYLYLTYGGEASKQLEDSFGCAKKPDIDEDEDEDEDHDDPDVGKKEEAHIRRGGGVVGGKKTDEEATGDGDGAVGGAVAPEALETHSRDGL